FVAAQSGFSLNFLPGHLEQSRLEFLDSRRVLFDEDPIENCSSSFGVEFQYALAERRQNRNIASGPDLQVNVRYLRSRRYRHLHRMLRIYELYQSALTDRVEGD